MVCAFRGWNDAAAAASTALAAIGNALDSEVVASIDPEEYFDFQSTRPTITMTAGETRRIEWPENNLIAVRVPPPTVTWCCSTAPSRTSNGAPSPRPWRPPPTPSTSTS